MALVRTIVVNGNEEFVGINPNVLPGRDRHVRQVTPRSHTIILLLHVHNRDKISIGTWNIRTLNRRGKLENLKREMYRMSVNIMVLCETKWSGAGRMLSDNETIIFSKGEEHKRGVAMMQDKNTSNYILGY